MPRQLFHDLRDPRGRVLPGSSICLYTGSGHLPQDGRARMAHVAWQSGHPEIRIRLQPAGGIHVQSQKEVQPVRFAVCPSLAYSFISRSVADHFSLATRRTIPVFCNVPSFRVIYGMNTYVLSSSAVQATVSIDYSDCSVGVRPCPVRQDRTYWFLVLDADSAPSRLQGIGAHIPEQLAVIGRNIINHMLLLYRGTLPERIRDTHTMGRLYFGYDDREGEGYLDQQAHAGP
jgi:hypothetical protein